LPGVASLGLLAAVAGLAGGLSWGLLLILGILGAVVAVLAPGVLYAAYLLIVFYKAAVQDYTPVDVTVLLAILTSAQAIPLLMGRSPRVSRVGVILWLTLTSLILAGVLYAVDQNLAIASAANWCALVFVPLLVGGLRVGSDPRYVRQFLWSFMAMGLLTTVLGLTLVSSTERLTFLGINTIQAGRAALLVPLVGVAFVLRGGGWLVRAAMVVLIPAALVVALATGSRGPLLALVVVALLGLMRYLSRPRSVDWRLAGIVGGLAIATVIVAAVVAPELPNSSLQRFTNLGDFIQGTLSGDLDTATGDTSAGSRCSRNGPSSVTARPASMPSARRCSVRRSWRPGRTTPSSSSRPNTGWWAWSSSPASSSWPSRVASRRAAKAERCGSRCSSSCSAPWSAATSSPTG
jgi:hypothetical protein